MSDTIGIVGAGNSASALAAYLSAQGKKVLIYARNLNHAQHLSRRHRVRASGLIIGDFPLVGVTNEPARLANECEEIFIATTTHCYEEVALTLKPFLTPRHIIMLFSSKLCGSLLFRETLSKDGSPSPLVVETDALFACRLQPDGSIAIKGLKDWTLFSCPQRTETKEKGRIIQRYFPNLEPAVNLVQRGCTDFGAHAHAVITLVNMSRIDNKHDFLFYYEGLSERTVLLLEEVEREIKNVASYYGAQIIPMAELLNRYYGCDTSSLYRAITTVPSYATIRGPDTLDHRFLHEDVGCTLVPLVALGRKAGVATPILDAVVAFSSALLRRDLAAEGRTLSKLGWDKLTSQDIKDWMDQ